MKRIKDIEPIINVYPKSKNYLKPFGIKLIYQDGTTKTFSGNIESALCAPLTKRQKKFIENIVKEMEG